MASLQIYYGSIDVDSDEYLAAVYTLELTVHSTAPAHAFELGCRGEADTGVRA